MPKVMRTLGGLGAAVLALTAGTCPGATDSVVTLSRVVIFPSAASLASGQQQQFGAYGRLSNGDSAAVSVDFAASGGTITGSGLYTAGSTAGAYQVVATQQGGTLADTATVTIASGAPTLVRLSLTPDSVAVDTAATQQFGVVGTYSDSSTGPVAVSYTATGGTISSGGLYTAGHTAGNFRVIATQSGGTLADTSKITVEVPSATLVRIILSPDTVTLDTSATKQFSVVGKFSDSSTAAVAVNYSATGGTVSAGGLYTAGHTAGIYRVIATQSGGSLADTSQVKIVLPTLVRVMLSPDSVTLDTAGTKQFSVVGKFSDSSTAAVAVTYSATGGTITSGGLYTAGHTAGTYRVIATQSGGSLADTSQVKIVLPTLVRVILSPDTVTLDTAATQQFSVVGKYSDSSTAAVSATYSATGGTISAGGLYTAGSTPGTYRVIASQSGLADTSTVTIVAATSSAECANPKAGWIWCDDFEQDRLKVPPAGGYFEVDSAGGNFTREAGIGRNGSYGMRGHFTAGASNAGSLHLAFGSTPSGYMKPVDAGTAKYREIYWRMYVMAQSGWAGGAHDKLSRALILGTSNFAEAMAAHVWGGDPPDTNIIILDPASGVDSTGKLVTTTYNDPNLKYLGQARSTTPIFDAAHVGSWYCVEAHVKLNDAGSANGVFELWINGTLEAQKTSMNWVSSYSAYGINAVYFENYWNAGAPKAEDRFFDNIVVSTQRIGC